MVRFLLKPLNDKMQIVYSELHNLDKDETWRIKLDLNTNVPFFNAIYDFDKYY